MSLSELWELVMDREAWRAVIHGVTGVRHDWVTELNWLTRNKIWMNPQMSYICHVLLPGKSHGQRSLVGCSPQCREESDKTERLHFHFSLSCIGEGNGNPLHCSCLENPRDRGAWCAAVYGVAQSWTRLTRLSRSSTWWTQWVFVTEWVCTYF